ncbi:UvrD-helicase domain-containing protein [Anaerovibrio lipolyticus]|uniref:UvrD-helicase domain-containing protein n=1 Tax=Anaerovibrio lipolyticus TaxID=82374 RepID=UPI0025CEF2E0|nr:UvrD-helicase domain-containing protein [Anaerovibrio lipolyticus]
MTSWIIPCNLKNYNVTAAFKKLRIINWKQSAKSIEKDDIVYIYVGKPVSAIKYKCVVNKVNIKQREIDDSEFVVDGTPYISYGNYMEIELVEEIPDDVYDLKSLTAHGLLGTIQGPRRASGELELFIGKDSADENAIDNIPFKNGKIKVTGVITFDSENEKIQAIKPTYIEDIKYLSKEYIPSEKGYFDVYEGQMFFYRPDGSKKYYSREYRKNKRNVTLYKVNPVKIIYVDNKKLIILNSDGEGLYCYDNYGTFPQLEITDVEPDKQAKYYKDIMYCTYGERPQKVVSDTPVVSNYSNLRGDFANYTEMDQDRVIKENVRRRMIINAGPGTGKTWTLIEKIIELVEVQDVDPDTILVLCFSKAAVEEIKNRLKQAYMQNRVSEVINMVDIRTFDSFATQVLYYVKEESEYDDLKYVDIGLLNYDERIKRFTSIIKSRPEILEQCEHLFVDEVQDLVNERAEMVIAIIKKLPEKSGVTLLGDACQSIYDYQATKGLMTSKQFYGAMKNMNRFTHYYFSGNHRQNKDLADLGDGYRKYILSGVRADCDSYWHNSVENVIPKFMEYEVEKISQSSIGVVLNQGTVGILTRTNGQALQISALLRKKGIDHILKKRLKDNTLNKWIALVFNDYQLTSISKDDFYDIYEEKNGLSPDVSEVWKGIKEAARVSADRIGIRDILKGILTNAKSLALYSQEKVSQLTVTNIHRGKGREFDTVLVEDSIFSDDGKALDEHKVCYVALTRPKQNIYRIRVKSEYTGIDKDGDRRCYKADFTGTDRKVLRWFEVTGEPDMDLKSFAREEKVQIYIRENHNNLVGKKVILIKESKSEYVRYKIMLEKEKIFLGYTSRHFYDSLSRILRIIYKLPKGKNPFFAVYPERMTDLYIDDVISVISQADGAEQNIKVYGEMVTWNAITVVGYSKAKYI